MRAASVNALLLLGSLFFAVLLVELVTRTSLPQQLVVLKRPDIWKPVDGLGWVHHTNTRTTVNTGEREVNFITDDRGFRIGATDRSESSHRILLLGDSFMEALQVEYEESLPGLLEERLSDQLGATVAVYNTGVGDWQPDQYYLQARRSLATHDFDLILVALFVDNDVISVRRQHVQPRVPTQHHSLRFPRAPSMAEMVDAIFYPINDFFEVRSHFFTLLKNRFQTALMRLRLSAAYFPDVFFRDEVDSNRWSVTAEICREIAAEGEARGIPTLFVLIPALYQVDTDIFHQYIRGFGLDTAAIDIDQPNHLLDPKGSFALPRSWLCAGSP